MDTRLEQLKEEKREVIQTIANIDLQILMLCRHGSYFASYNISHPALVELKAKKINLTERLSELDHSISTCIRHQ